MHIPIVSEALRGSTVTLLPEVFRAIEVLLGEFFFGAYAGFRAAKRSAQ
jgi:hypothetical protein